MRKAFLGALGTALAACALMAPAAFAANEDLRIREVFGGGSEDTAYVEIQALSADQNHLAGKTVKWTGITPTEQFIPGSFTFPSDVDNGANQMTVLLAAPGYSGPVAPDFTVPGLKLWPRWGNVCIEGIDCVAWGNGGGGAGALQNLGIPPGKALVRLIGHGCPTMLELADDTPFTGDFNGDNGTPGDWSFGTPNPRNNDSPIVETPCGAPNTGINDASVGEGETTADTSVRVAFSASPSIETTYQCKLDSGAFEPCTSPVEYTGLAESAHTFEVRALRNGTVEATPAALHWTVDTSLSLLSAPAEDTAGPGSAAAAVAAQPAAAPAAASAAAPAAQPAPAQRATTKKKRKKHRAKRGRRAHR